jgi:hypothetical protein
MKRALLTSLAVASVLYAIAITWKKNERAAGLDFYIYFVAGQLAGRADVDNIYSAEVQQRIGEEYYARAEAGTSELRKYDAKRRRRLDNVSSPFLYSTLRWVSRDYERALAQDHLLILAAFIAGVLLIARRVGLPWWAALFLLAALIHYYRGFEADLRVGNVNSLQLLMFSVALWSPPFLAGLVLGLLLSFKPNLILVVLLLVFSRIATRSYARLRAELAGGLTGGLLAFVIAAVSYGSARVWLQWIVAANQFWHRLPTRMERNVTPALRFFHEHGTWPSYVLAALLLVLACAAIWRGRSRDDVLIASIGVTIYLLSATVVWLHYMVLALPIAIALMRFRGTAIIALVSLALIAEEPFEMLVGRPAADVEVWLIGPALFALFLCAIWKLASNRDPRPAVL